MLDMIDYALPITVNSIIHGSTVVNTNNTTKTNNHNHDGDDNDNKKTIEILSTMSDTW
jgi:hypothetical protein